MRQGPDGRWWVQATLQVPADAVQHLPGEDYSRVPREPQYALETARHDRPGHRALTLHHIRCWAAVGDLLPVESTTQAAGLLGFGDTEACTVCEPAPADVLAALRAAGRRCTAGPDTGTVDTGQDNAVVGDQDGEDDGTEGELRLHVRVVPHAPDFCPVGSPHRPDAGSHLTHPHRGRPYRRATGPRPLPGAGPPRSAARPHPAPQKTAGPRTS